jgi:hypothetical protein
LSGPGNGKPRAGGCPAGAGTANGIRVPGMERRKHPTVRAVLSIPRRGFGQEVVGRRRPLPADVLPVLGAFRDLPIVLSRTSPLRAAVWSRSSNGEPSCIESATSGKRSRPSGSCRSPAGVSPPSCRGTRARDGPVFRTRGLVSYSPGIALAGCGARGAGRGGGSRLHDLRTLGPLPRLSEGRQA